MVQERDKNLIHGDEHIWDELIYFLIVKANTTTNCHKGRKRMIMIHLCNGCLLNEVSNVVAAEELDNLIPESPNAPVRERAIGHI